MDEKGVFGMNTTTTIIAVSALAFGLAQATVNFPFPQNVDYGNGIEVSDKATAATQLKSAFNYYLTDKYKESGNYAAIEKDHGGNNYVSEGTGYGMLMMVYFSDNTTSYQDKFDKLWAFYKAGSNEHGLMNWSFGGLNPYDNKANAATDAEMDVAAALIMAAYQFGDDKYLDEARTLLKNVKKYEFEENGLHKPGDAWNDKKNPSYIAPAYYRLFAAVDTDNATFWNTTAMNTNYALLETNSAEYSTGLFDNWSDASGKGLDKYYGYDAARTPWRLAQDFYWFGETKAKTMLSKLGTWVSKYAASAMKGTIERSGNTMWNDHNSTFVATLMTSLVTDDSRQSKLDEYWKEVASLGDEAYFEQSMKILCGLLVTGNMPNFTDKDGPKPSSSASQQGESSSSQEVSSASIQPASSGSQGTDPQPISSNSVQPSSSNGQAVNPDQDVEAIGSLAQSTIGLSIHGRILHINGIDAADVSVFDMQGRPVQIQHNVSGNMSLKDIATGSYIVQIKARNANLIRKISVK